MANTDHRAEGGALAERHGASPSGQGAHVKNPAADHRFKPGQSGNPNGRPKGSGKGSRKGAAKGRPNVANLVGDRLNRKVPVRVGDTTRIMPSGEAMVRVLMMNAGKGKMPALSVVLDLFEMTGRSHEITEEEKQRRQLSLPRPFTTDEYDLIQSPARERERMRCWVSCEENEGDRLAADGNNAQALAVYRFDLSACKARSAQDAGDAAATAGLSLSVARIGLLADRLLLAGDFAGAVRCADEALAERQGLDLTWIDLIRAHALMFLGRVEEARAFYLHFDTNFKRQAVTAWENVILQDFCRFRQAGHTVALMVEIETRLVVAGWSTQSRMSKTGASPQADDESVSAGFAHADDLSAADQLAQYGKLDEAAEAYRRVIALCRANVGKEGADAVWRTGLELAAERLARLAAGYIRAAKFAAALAVADEAIAAVPDLTVLQLHRACALMVLDRTDAARAIFLQHAGAIIACRSWMMHVFAAFDDLRRGGTSRPLMDEIEGRLGAPGTATALPRRAGAAPCPPSTLDRAAAADDLVSADLLAGHGRRDEAFTVYLRRLRACHAGIVTSRITNRTIDDRNAAVDKIATLTRACLCDKDDEKTLAMAEAALELAPDAIALKLARAHALMFLGRRDEARALYGMVRDARIDAETTAGERLARDFAALRAAGRTHPLMEEIVVREVAAA
jgi:tetratricopeptide (TPR) repeat protein